MKYKDAGVDIDAANAAVEKIKRLVRKTYTDGVLTDVGLFSGAYSIASTGLKDPILLSSIDGLGTKLRVAMGAQKFASLGRDIVSHCCNDVLVHGAQPLFFLDYIAMHMIDQRILEELISGMADECVQWNCALIGGETAEMPGFYGEGEFDLVGCVVGIVEKDCFIDGSRVRPGDRLIGFPSTGLHTNGFSLARKILFEKEHLRLDDTPSELDTTVEEALLAVHRSYLKPVRLLLAKALVTGMAHITGGGFFDNLRRILPDSCEAIIEKGTWPTVPIFSLLTERGDIDEAEAFRTFNMGIGFVAFVREENLDEAMVELRSNGESAFLIGSVAEGRRGVRLV